MTKVSRLVHMPSTSAQSRVGHQSGQSLITRTSPLVLKEPSSHLQSDMTLLPCGPSSSSSSVASNSSSKPPKVRELSVVWSYSLTTWMRLIGNSWAVPLRLYRPITSAKASLAPTIAQPRQRLPTLNRRSTRIPSIGLPRSLSGPSMARRSGHSRLSMQTAMDLSTPRPR